MKNIEKALIDSIKGKGSKVPLEEILSDTSKNTDEWIHLLFNIINQELDQVTSSEQLEPIREIIPYVQAIVSHKSDVNRHIVMRKLHKLDEKIDRLKIENRKKYYDIKNAYTELEKIRKEIEKVVFFTEKKETHQYDFISYLIHSIRNMIYLEYTFSKMPQLISVKDKNQVSLFSNVVSWYLESIQEEEEENIYYYNNVLSLIQSQKEFSLSNSERKKLLETLYETIDQMSVTKKKQKQNQDKIEWISLLIDSIKGIDDTKQRMELIADRYNISIAFSEDLLEQISLIQIPKAGRISDRHAVNEYIVTMDGEDSVEIDDGLSCRKLANGNYLLGVHIASVLGYFSYESSPVQEALSRVQSIYLPTRYQHKEEDYKRVIPIFPYSFSAKEGSLLPGTQKLARSYFFEIDSDGEVVSEKFLKTIIVPSMRLTYEEANEILEKGSSFEKLEKVMENLHEVTHRLEKKYAITDYYESMYEEYFTENPSENKSIRSERIVYQTMVLTGNKVAEYFAKKQYPCLYRIHEFNESNHEKLQVMIDSLTKTYGGDQYKKLYQLIRGIYPRGWYGLEGSHMGLKLNHYCHVTSELRRAADIVVEHALEVCYDKEPTSEEVKSLEEEIRMKALSINAKQDPIDWFLKDYKKAMQKRR